MAGIRITRTAKIFIKRHIRFSAHILSILATLAVPLVEFNFITSSTLKWTVYALLLLSVLGTSGSLLLNQIPGRVKATQIKRLIVHQLDITCILLAHNRPAHYRTCLFMLPKKNSKTIRIEYCSTGMDGAADIDIELEKFQGCTGTAWGEKKPAIADLTIQAQEGGPKWQLTDKQKELTQKLKAILSIPIFHPKHHNQVIAILSIDSNEAVADFLMNDTTQELVATHAGLFSELLCTLDSPLPL